MVAAEETFDGYLRLFDADGRELANNDDDEPGRDPFLRTYLVEPADETSGRAADTGDYLLSLEVTPMSVPSGSMEPNDDDPTLIESVPAVLTHQFIGDGDNHRLDVDRFAVALDGPSIVTADRRRLSAPVCHRPGSSTDGATPAPTHGGGRSATSNCGPRNSSNRVSSVGSTAPPRMPMSVTAKTLSARNTPRV